MTATKFDVDFSNKCHLPGTAIGTTVTEPGMACHTSCVYFFCFFLQSPIY
jgi:hypothetical protein